MIKNTVEYTKDLGLCCSCGICKGICPKSSITYKRKDGLFLPEIAKNSCIECGICKNICPGLVHEYQYEDPIKAMTGDSICSYSAWSKDEKLRFVSASGGCVSTLITELLKKNKYDYATTVNSYNYKEQLVAELISCNDISDYSQSTYPKSRYLSVSFEKVVRFLMNNKDKKIIIVGVSCAIRGIENEIKQLKLDRENYLLIGLFCDKVFNYNIFEYYNTVSNNTEGKNIRDLHFKNKESGGWPGNMKWFFSDGTYMYVDSSERMKLKAYFMPERCLYCIDKINVQADISVGDNFTEVASSKQGSNSVIIRTDRGMEAWNDSSDALLFSEVDISLIADAQCLTGRRNNAYFAQIKGKKNEKELKHLLNSAISLCDDMIEYGSAYYAAMKRLNMGKDFDKNPEKYFRDINTDLNHHSSNKVVRTINRGYWWLRRKIRAL